MLSKRLTMIFDLIEPCKVLVDIGSDHGYLALQALSSHKAKQVIASDLAIGPLKQSQKTFAQANVFENGRTILSDGLRSVDVDPDCAVLAGMGAELIIQIVQQDLSKFKRISQIITQANTKINVLRSTFNQLGFTMMREEIILDGFFYVAQSYRYTGLCEELNQTEIYFGQFLNLDKDVYRQYLENEKNRLIHILSSHPQSKHHLNLLNLLDDLLNTRVD